MKKAVKKTKKKNTFLRTLLRIAGVLIACAAAVAAICCVIGKLAKKFGKLTKEVCVPEPSAQDDADDKELNELLDSINEAEASANDAEEASAEPAEDETETASAETEAEEEAN